jgi:hypothetical protein
VVLWVTAVEFSFPVDCWLMTSLGLCWFGRAEEWQLWVVMAAGAAQWVYCAVWEDPLPAGEGGWTGSPAWTALLAARYVAGAPSWAWAAPRVATLAMRLQWPRRVSLVHGALVLAAAERCSHAAAPTHALRSLWVLQALGGALLTALMGSAAPAVLALLGAVLGVVGI